MKPTWLEKYRSDYEGLTEDEIDIKMKHRKDNKGDVLGIADRKEGSIRVIAFPANKLEFVGDTVKAKVEKGANLHTDETRLYDSLETYYHRESVIHSKREWVKPSISASKVHTNYVENFWSVMKRGVYGI